MSRKYDRCLVDSENSAVRQAAKVCALNSALFAVMFLMYGLAFWFGGELIADSLPNLLDDIVPDGEDDSQNALVEEWGDVTKLSKTLKWTDDFTPLWHDDIADHLDGWKAEHCESVPSLAV